MQIRPARLILGLSAAILVLTLAIAPHVAGPFADTHAASQSSEATARSTVADSPSAIVRVDLREPPIDRTVKNRVVLLAVITTLVALAAPALGRARARVRQDRTGIAVPSPFWGRAPPQTLALGA
jgi:hypothetical protein